MSANSGRRSIWLYSERYYRFCHAWYPLAIYFTVTSHLNSYRLYNLGYLDPRVGCLWKGIHLRQINRMNICLFTLVLFIAQIGIAEQQVPIGKVVEQQFTPLFSEVSVQLSTDKQRYLTDPMAFQEFIDLQLRPLWDMRSTARALVGPENFNAITEAQRQDLVDAVRHTMARYAFEGLEKYSGQQFHIVDVVINQRANMGWVQVLMESALIPDIVLDVLVKQADPEQGTWQAVDIRFKGITYVSVKKHSFRETIEEQGIETLITDLKRKNRDYFADICSKTQSSGRAPCALIAE